MAWTKKEKVWYRRFGRNVAKAREKQGLNQTELARLLGKSRVSVSNIERGAQGTKLHNLELLCDALNVGFEKLLPPRP